LNLVLQSVIESTASEKKNPHNPPKNYNNKQKKTKPKTPLKLFQGKKISRFPGNFAIPLHKARVLHQWPGPGSSTTLHEVCASSR